MRNLNKANLLPGSKPGDSPPIHVRFPQGTYDKLKALAAREDRTLSAMVRRLVGLGLELRGE